ncbi:MAG TPA: hypothetical protein DC032_09220 [Pseudomonas sp.]|nr:hypothetical protein [Pseudomonas sp.]
MLSFFRRLFRSQSFDADGYITIVYPQKGHGVIVHDTLTSNRPLSTANYMHTADSIDLLEEEFQSDEPMFMTNPATGLPMLNDFIDTGGNMFGFGGD